MLRYVRVRVLLTICVCVSLCSRLKRPLLRSYCGATGYGWDYPDSEFRDVPLGFPLVLSQKPLLLVLSDFGFRLRATGHCSPFCNFTWYSFLNT